MQKMNRQEQRVQQTNRVVFVGCQFCGEVYKPLRNYGSGKICPECLKKKNVVSESDTGKE